MQLFQTMNQTDKARCWAVLQTTIGTGIAGPNQNAFSDTSAVFALYNNSGSPPGRVIYPDHIKLICTAAGTGSGKIAISIDSAQRGITANSGVQVGNTDSDSIGSVAGTIPAAGSIAFVQFGAIVPGAATSKRVFVANDYAKNAAFAVGDEILILFNQNEVGLGAQATKVHIPVPLVSLGPSGLMLVHLYNMTAAPSFELEAAHWELS